MRTLITIPSLITAFLQSLISQPMPKHALELKPVENEEIFDHLFIE